MPRYDAYLLRVWRGDPAAGARWAIRLEHLPDGQYQRFGSLEGLLVYLRDLLAEEVTGPAAGEPALEHETTAPD